MPLRLIAASLLFVAACDSSDPSGPAVDPADPAGEFAIDPLWFEYQVLSEPSVNGWENLQAWIDGSVRLTQSNGALSGSGSCTVRRRRHKAWLGETSDESSTLAFTASGTVSDGTVVLTLQGCAWVMARYTGTFADGAYSLRVGELASAPAWTPDLWSSAQYRAGDDPRDLGLERE
jgi:hypothetical protein